MCTGLKQEESKRTGPTKPMMSDAEFHNFLDSVGHLVQPQQFRLSVYQGGVEPSLRRVVWRHLLNVYPEGLSGRERFEYLKTKVNEYYRLRDEWRDMFLQGKDMEAIKAVTSMVKKDVLRTDRMHTYFAGSDDNQNVLSLFNLLVTFALTHPEVSYCQGMSDIASPILVVQNDEAHAYICFCGAMKRLRSNFMLDGEAMTTKFQHLAIFLQHQDPVFFAYLKEHNADDMFFCYRWLLLEMKREFALEDAMYMLEIMWSSLLPDPPELEIPLVDAIYKEHGLKAYSLSSPTFSNNVYMHLMSQRKRQSNSMSENSSCDKQNSEHSTDSKESANNMDSLEGLASVIAITPCEDAKTIDPKDFVEMNDDATAVLQEKSVIIDRSLESSGEEDFAVKTNGVQLPSSSAELAVTNGSSAISPDSVEGSESPSADTQLLKPEISCSSERSLSDTGNQLRGLHITETHPLDSVQGASETPSVQQASRSASDGHIQRPSEIPIRKSYEAKNVSSTASGETSASPSLHLCAEASPSAGLELNSCEEAVEHPSIDFVKVTEKPPQLPPPQTFGAGNPFLMCLCLSLLLQHRDHIIQNKMDYNELAMHFDKMVRKQNVHRVVHQAQVLYAGYLKYQQGLMDREAKNDDPRL